MILDRISMIGKQIPFFKISSSQRNLPKCKSTNFGVKEHWRFWIKDSIYHYTDMTIKSGFPRLPQCPTWSLGHFSLWRILPEDISTHLLNWVQLPTLSIEAESWSKSWKSKFNQSPSSTEKGVHSACPSVGAAMCSCLCTWAETAAPLSLDPGH